MVRDSLSQAQNDAKSTWNTINELLGRKKSSKALPRSFFLNDNNDEVSDPKLIANKFNFFVNVGPNLAKKFSRETDDFYKIFVRKL